MVKNKRFVSVLLALSIVFVMLFSAVYIASRAEHECPGEDCIICLRIDICKNAFTVLRFVAAAVLTVTAVFKVCALISEKPIFAEKSDTLVSLKVKLSD